jgi:predicted acyl esterase
MRITSTCPVADYDAVKGKLAGIGIFAVWTGLALAGAQARPAILVDKNVAARMRDGVVLRADVYRPDTTERLPALLERTPYSKNPAHGLVRHAAERNNSQPRRSSQRSK